VSKQAEASGWVRPSVGKYVSDNPWGDWKYTLLLTATFFTKKKEKRIYSYESGNI
jgi:hypothetical protein